MTFHHMQLVNGTYHIDKFGGVPIPSDFDGVVLEAALGSDEPAREATHAPAL